VNDLIIASILTGLIFLAGALSIEIGISAAVLEVIAGFVATNFLHVNTTPWIIYIASSGGILLTFLAGVEINIKLLHDKWKETAIIGGLSTLVPAILSFCFVYFFLHWTIDAAKITAIAMSTTSVAVVYTVLIDSGLIEAELGKVLMAATFVTDFGAVLALSILFLKFTIYTFIFLVFCAILLLIGPKVIHFFFKRYRDRVIEQEIKLIFFVFFITMLFAEIGKIEAVLPVFILGLIMSDLFEKNHDLVKKLRTIGFAFITPFFFINSGMKVALSAVMKNLPLVFSLLFIKIAGKTIGVYPSLSIMMPKETRRAKIFFVLIKCTGLTFGTIASIFGFQNGYIDKTQFSVLISVILLSAIIPTIIAQKWFSPAKSVKKIIETQKKSIASKHIKLARVGSK